MKMADTLLIDTMFAKLPIYIFRNPDGKVYYYNTITKASSWTEPEELKKAKREAEQIDAQVLSTSK